MLFDWLKSDRREKVISEATRDLFEPYFIELNDKVVNTDYNIKFMVRSIGLTASLIPYIE